MNRRHSFRRMLLPEYCKYCIPHKIRTRWWNNCLDDDRFPDHYLYNVVWSRKCIQMFQSSISIVRVQCIDNSGKVTDQRKLSKLLIIFSTPCIALDIKSWNHTEIIITYILSNIYFSVFVWLIKHNSSVYSPHSYYTAGTICCIWIRLVRNSVPPAGTNGPPETTDNWVSLETLYTSVNHRIGAVLFEPSCSKWKSTI